MIKKMLPKNLLFLCFLCPILVSYGQNATLHTVQGTISPKDLGLTLTHEHVMSNFGKPMDSTAIYDEVKLLDQVVPYLKNLRALGVDAIFDCTAEYFGRRVDLLKKISEETDIHIITNTGIYGSADDRYIPVFAYKEDAGHIADLWIDEFKNGIQGTKIKPGFVKLAFDNGKPSEIDQKLFKAGLLTHLETGLTLAVHTGENLEAAQLQLKMLEQHQVHPKAWIWVHANKFIDDAMLLETAAKGAWISFDGVNSKNYQEYIPRIKKFRKSGLLHKILLSHDGNGFPKGGAIRKFDAILNNLIPALLENGFTKAEIEKLTVQNPQDAFAISIRKTD